MKEFADRFVPFCPGLQKLLLVGWISAQVVAQTPCSEWTGRQPLAGTNDLVNVVTYWDSDGPGPEPEVMVFGGGFSQAGDVEANRVATFDPTTGVWAPLGTGIYSAPNGFPRVLAFTTLLDGSLVVGGNFAPAGGVFAADGVARWDGSNWDRFGPGVTGEVDCLATLPNGDLIAGGTFTVTGTNIQNVARWDGTAWSAMGSTVTGRVRVMTVAPNGQPVLAWQLPFGSGSVMRVVAWDGQSWSAIGSDFGYLVQTLNYLPTGELVAGSASFNQSVVFFDGVTWSPLGTLTSGLNAAAVLANGDLVVAAPYYYGSSGGAVARWDGVAWSPLSSGDFDDCRSLAASPSGRLLAGGDFTDPGIVTASRVAEWDGAAWWPIGTGAGGTIMDMISEHGGGVVASGQFRHIGGELVNHIAEWTEAGWSPLGAGLDTPCDWLRRRANGNLVARQGFFLGAQRFELREWDGLQWTTLSFPTNDSVRGLIDLANGDVVVHGDFTMIGGVAANGIARWDGANWSALGGGSSPVSIDRMFELQNGDLVAIGSFQRIGGLTTRGIARWQGSAWTSFGGGATNVVSDFLELPDGDLLALGGFSIGGSFAPSLVRWDGVAWSFVGQFVGLTQRMIRLPNGDVLVAGRFSSVDGVTAGTVARWDGTTWSAEAIGSGGLVRALAFAGDGDVAVAGAFDSMDGEIASNFVRLVSVCAAETTTVGVGCAAAGTPSSYASVASPWIGSTFRARGSDVPAPAFAAVVTGYQSTSVPLASILPPSPSGCSLLVTPDAVELVAATASTLDADLAIPNLPSLVGAVLYQQLVFIELDAAGMPLRSSASNGLRITIGSF